LLVAPPGHRALSATFLEPSVDEPYILAVGAVTPRKGFQYLIEAVHRLGSGAPLLVLAGPDGWRANVIHKRITALGLEGRVRALGYIDDGALEGWYRRALLLCHPSEAEGFGIPVLEAMAYGVPVVATDIPPVREIGGDGILLVPPNDPGALSEAIGTLIGDDDLRGRLSVRGRSLAAPFTWSRMTDTIVEGYRHVLGSELH
jgi:glycosyltransferase involved in cell wall biosynthesis